VTLSLRNFFKAALVHCALIPLALVHFSSTLRADPASDPYGKSESALLGIFYDLKQTNDRKPTNVDHDLYAKVVDEFLSKDWDENVLNRYYRVSRLLYTTQIFMPGMNADNLPTVLHVDKAAKPTRWLAQFKGQVSPPEPGTYRFVGTGDDVMAVAVNGKTELVFNRIDVPLSLTTWKSSSPDSSAVASENLRNGDWFEVGPGEAIDLDIIMGDNPGYGFHCEVMIEKKGEHYNSDAQGHPILPIFQVAPYDTPPADPKFSPPFQKSGPVWKCYQ